MPYDNHFGGVIWTNHALQRLSQRGIKQGDAWATWKNPDQSRYAATQGTWVYYKTYPSAASTRGGQAGQGQKIEVVAKQNEKKQWIILSIWSKPVYEYQNNKVEPLWKFIFKKIFKKKTQDLS